MTCVAMTDLTRARGLIAIRCHKLPLTGVHVGHKETVLQLEYMVTYRVAWNVMCQTVMVPVDVPKSVRIDVLANAGMHGVAMDQIAAVVQWPAGHSPLPHHVRITVQFEDMFQVENWVERDGSRLQAMRVGTNGVSVGVVGVDI
ncbi:hypothetical protein AMAG_20185 [Allomyces macrogynus ATCC 38327]|uniref:Uncharacterized protein n=1 Tax=Allomyces macrogynus (strain ATCC 38327) TaxID=578462 RepID=A0A0L0T8E2_ALLM3|nr:hypothetical protein AMAG_20185 [Allomyces macrogynus ATCC 38327]|eukprot:KNE70844.1 hypothetical protein AMAG_20185 [Allomyces macrogynus ATCC 38327]